MKMITTSNPEQKSDVEEVNSSNIDDKSKANDNRTENNESYTSEKTVDTSNSNISPNMSETSTNIDNNYKLGKNNPNFYDQSMNGYQPNFGYGYCPPQFYGFENPLMNNFGYQFLNPYYDYNQQMMFYPNYPAYFPVDYSTNWNPYGPKNVYQDQRKYRYNNNSQKINQNYDANSYQQRKYKKPFNRRGENQKPEEEKPKIPDYDLMKNEQVYVESFPALAPKNTKQTSFAPAPASSSCQQPAIEEINSKDETKGVNKENEIERTDSVGWAGKKWSEIVNGNQMHPEYQTKNESKQQDATQTSLEKQMNGLKIYSDSDSNKMTVQSKVSCWSHPIKC